MIDFNHGSLKKGKAGVPTPALLDAGAQSLQSKQAKRDYLGGSRLGEACGRKLQFEYRGEADRRPMSATTHMIFAAGHSFEKEVADLLKAGGFDLRVAKRNGGQFGFETAGGRIRGHIDGVVCGGPAEFGPYPYLWENKAVAAKYWTAIVKRGVRVERPVYAGQIATYQAYMGLEEHPALFSVVNRDTGEIAFERVPFDAKLAQECTDRGVAVLQAEQAGEMLPRAYASADFFECKFCGFADRCWA